MAISSNEKKPAKLGRKRSRDSLYNFGTPRISGNRWS